MGSRPFAMSYHFGSKLRKGKKENISTLRVEPRKIVRTNEIVFLFPHFLTVRTDKSSGLRIVVGEKEKESLPNEVRKS